MDEKDLFGKGTDIFEIADEFEGGYEWRRVRVFYSPSKRRFFWYDAEGCSCNSWEEYASASNFKDGLKDDVLRDLKENDYHDAWEDVRAFRHRKTPKKA